MGYRTIINEDGSREKIYEDDDVAKQRYEDMQKRSGMSDSKFKAYLSGLPGTVKTAPGESTQYSGPLSVYPWTTHLPNGLTKAEAVALAPDQEGNAMGLTMDDVNARMKERDDAFFAAEGRHLYDQFDTSGGEPANFPQGQAQPNPNAPTPGQQYVQNQTQPPPPHVPGQQPPPPSVSPDSLGGYGTISPSSFEGRGTPEAPYMKPVYGGPSRFDAALQNFLSKPVDISPYLNTGQGQSAPASAGQAPPPSGGGVPDAGAPPPAPGGGGLIDPLPTGGPPVGTAPDQMADWETYALTEFWPDQLDNPAAIAAMRQAFPPEGFADLASMIAWMQQYFASNSGPSPVTQPPVGTGGIKPGGGDRRGTDRKRF